MNKKGNLGEWREEKKRGGRRDRNFTGKSLERH
jgi:hypothetical protein